MSKGCFGILLLLFIAGCSKRPDISGVTPNIVRKDQLSWRCEYEGKTWVEAKAYIFREDPNLEERYNEMKDFLEEKINDAKEKQYTAPNKELRLLEKEELEAYTTGDSRQIAEWANWPMVMVFPVFLEEATPSKAIAKCRYETRSVDILFTIYCPDEVSLGDFLDLIRYLTFEIEQYSDEEWEKLYIEDRPIYDENDANSTASSKEIMNFVEDAVFIQQR